jgi:hypothetical protein
VIRCRDCRHWAPRPLSPRDEKRSCRLISQDCVVEPYPHTEQTSAVELTGGEASDFVTSPDFGCLLGESVVREGSGGGGPRT